MRIQLVVSALPPLLDGIGDYAANLARELAGHVKTSVLTTSDAVVDPIEGVRIVPAFSPERRRSVLRLVDFVSARRPDWIILQFNQFSFGRWGLNPFLPLAMGRIRRRCPGTRIAVMFHEDFVPPIDWKFAIMRLWQRPQFKALGRSADVVFFSIDTWVRQYRDWFAGKPVIHLPVGSNLPQSTVDRAKAKARLGIADDTVVLGMFGTARWSRNLKWVASATNALKQDGRRAMLLYVGADGKAVREAIADFPAIAEGPLPAQEVAQRLRAVDVFLAPFSDGISTRRTSMICALQQGIAVVATRGVATDDLLERENGRSILLADANATGDFASGVRALAGDSARRQQLATSGRELFQREFTWDRIARRLLGALSSAETR